MEKKIVQLLVDGGGSRLAKRDAMEYSEFPCEVVLDDKCLLALEGDSAGIYASPVGDIELKLNGNSLAEKSLLRPGDVLSAGNHELIFYLKHEHRGLSFSSLLLARLVKIAVFAFFIVEMWIMFGLPSLITNADVWDGAIARHSVAVKLDSLRKQISKNKTKDPIKKLLLAEISEELNSRVRYFRAYDTILRPGQRRQMLKELDNFGEILDKLDDDTPLIDTPPVDVDKAVLHIIGK